MSDARQTRYDRRRRSCRTNSEFDSIRGEYRFFECRKTGSQTESKNRFIRFFPYRYTTLLRTGDVPHGSSRKTVWPVSNKIWESGRYIYIYIYIYIRMTGEAGIVTTSVFRELNWIRVEIEDSR